MMLPHAVKFTWLTHGCNVITIDCKAAMRVEHLTGNCQKWPIKCAQQFVVAGTFKSSKLHATNHSKRSTTGIFVSYKLDNTGNCMIMVDPKNNFTRFFTQDLTWLKRNYYQPSLTEKKNG